MLTYSKPLTTKIIFNSSLVCIPFYRDFEKIDRHFLTQIGSAYRLVII